ncbi:InlB B-repeat-containing protein [Bifidobacterium asteroides]|uniref:RCC1 domain-containing protein n=1 Tax=Bifidobacterium asteroides TaxID=1684 RepID=UPI003A7FC8C3
MHLGTRLRRASATAIVLLGLLAGLGVASANADDVVSASPADTPVFSGGGGGRQTPRVAEQTPDTLPNSTTSTPLPSPSPLQTASPLNPTAPSPVPSTPKDATNSTSSSTAKPSGKTDGQASHTVRFDPDDGNTPTQATVKAGTLASPPGNNPVREGFRFDGWTRDGQPFDFQTPILQDTRLTARWTKATDWTLSPDHGPASGTRVTINPPSLQEPYYMSIQAAGDQFTGLTGDGRIYIWAQDGTPKQVPSPAQAPDGFRYQQTATGNQWQAAIGSDQHIYTWTGQQPTPTILDTKQNTKFTSISTSDDLLLAVDQQGQVHAFQAGQTDSRNMKPTEQSTISLPGQAQATLAVASPSRTLIVDTDGQAWAWDTSRTANVKPERIRQDQGMRITQAQALSQGFLLLDAKGQAHHLADSETSPATTGLPENMKASRITVNKNQAVTTGTDGHIWTWKPGETPMRADNGNQPYMQAVRIGNRITALDRQGSLYQWSINTQGQPDKPAKVDSTQAATLESASLDGQALTLIKTDGSWQAEMPASQPGPVTITLAGRQDNQPFTRTLDYTVDQTLTRTAQPGSTYKISFSTAGGSQAPQAQQVAYPFGRVQRPYPNPTRSGYQFDGWFIGNAAYDFSKPVTSNLTLTAHWTYKDPNNTWRINPDTGSQLGHETTTITPPTSQGIRFNQTSSSSNVKDFSSAAFSLAVGSDGNAYSWGNNMYGQLGNGTNTNQTTPVQVKKPAGAPANFTYMQISAGASHSLAIGSDGYVYAWGNNNHGQLGNNNTKNSSVPVRVYGASNSGEGLKAIQVCAGMWNSMALGIDGTVFSWGSQARGYDTTSGTTPQTIPTTVEDSSDPSGVFHAVQISTSWSFNLAIGQDGYVYVWGYNTNGQFGNNTSDGIHTTTVHSTPSRIPNPAYPQDTGRGWRALQVSAGGWHALVIDEENKIWAWGFNRNGQIGNGSSSDYNANPLPKQVRINPNDSSTSLKATQVSAGIYHSMAIDTNGSVWAWGQNDNGQVGNGTTNDQLSPVKVFDSAQSTSSAGPWLKAVQLNAGYKHSLAIDSRGDTRAWGNNFSGQLGNGISNNDDSANPIPVSVLFNLQPVITAARFDTSPGTNLAPVSNSNSVTVLTPPHQPGTVTVSVDYTLGGKAQSPVTSLRYTYTPAGVLPHAGGEGILLALATGMTSMGAVLASLRHRRERHRLLHTSHE